MLSQAQLSHLLPLACAWIEEQETLITNNGVPLNDVQKRDAYLIGVSNIENVRLLKVDQIPQPVHSELKEATERIGFLAPGTIGISFRYGIYIRDDHWNRRNLIVHELTHTMQYEVLGGIRPFLERYLDECLTVGYMNSSLEQEARSVEQELCF